MVLKNPNTTMAEVKNNLEMRDHIDSHREVSPLRQANDALLLDNTHISMEAQLDFALKLVAKVLKIQTKSASEEANMVSE